MKLLRVIILAFAISTVMATYVRRPHLYVGIKAGTYSVKSDCQGNSKEGTLVVSSVLGNKQLLQKGTDFGFPSDHVINGEVSSWDTPNTVKSTGDRRVCKSFVWGSENDSALFVCYLDEEIVCTIYLDLIS